MEMEEKIDNTETLDNEKSTSFGKFKSAEELLKAYNSLQSEFTKRSQKLAEYEKNSVGKWEGKVAEFVKEYPIAEKYADELAQEVENADISGDNVLERSLIKVLSKKVRTEEELISDEDLVKKVLNSGSNREKVINGYLDDVRRNASPITFPQGGAIPVTPPVRAKSIREAGELAKKMIEFGDFN